MSHRPYLKVAYWFYLKPEWLRRCQWRRWSSAQAQNQSIELKKFEYLNRVELRPNTYTGRYLIAWHDYRYRSSPSICRMREVMIKLLFVGLSRFGRIWNKLYRNSYGYRKSHIYETVKLNQTKLSNQPSCGEREKTFKALIDHDIDWTLIAQSYFLWQRTTAWWAQ